MRAVATTGLALCLALMPLTATRAASPSSDADPIAEARTLHELGLEQFKAGEYDNALKLWKRALVSVPHDDELQGMRAMMVGNIIAAHRLAYEAGRNPEHLVEAMRVIDLRKTELANLEREVIAGEVLELDTQRAELARLQELALRNGELPSELPPGTAFRTEPVVLTDHQLDKAITNDNEFAAEHATAKGMVIGGIVLLAASAPLLIGTMFSLNTYVSPKDSDPSEIVPTLATLATIAGVTVIAGGTLVGIGNKRMKRVRQDYRDRLSPSAMLVPVSLPRGGGVGFVGRF